MTLINSGSGELSPSHSAAGGQLIDVQSADNLQKNVEGCRDGSGLHK